MIIALVLYAAIYLAVLLHYRELSIRPQIFPPPPIAKPPRLRRHRMTPEMRKEVRNACLEAALSALVGFGTMWAFWPSHQQDRDCDH
jgi:hypothetical protein